MKTSIIFVIGAACIAAATHFGTGREMPAAVTPSYVPQAAAPVAASSTADDQAVGMQAEPAAAVRQYPALVVPRKRLEIRAGTSGTIKSVAGEENSTVTAQSLLVEIDSSQLAEQIRAQLQRMAAVREQVSQARIDARIAQDQLERINDCNRRKEKTFTDSAVFQAAQRVKAAQTAIARLTHEFEAMRHDVESQRCVLEDHRARAPLAGRISHVVRHPGQYVAEGDTVLWLDSHELLLKVQLPDNLASTLHQCQFSLTDGDQLETPLVVARCGDFNPDGSRDVLLELPTAAGCQADQIVEITIRRKG